MEFPSTDEDQELDFQHNPKIAINNNSASHPANEDLDVKLPTSMKRDDMVLDDLSHTSIPRPQATMNSIGVDEQMNVSHHPNDIHLFNNNNKMNSRELDEQVHSKVTEVNVTTQENDTVAESMLASKTTAKAVNLNHMKEFQECMNSYEVGNGVHSFDMIALAIAFYECS